MSIEKTSLIDIVPTEVEADIRLLSVSGGKYQGLIQTRWYDPLPFPVEPSQADVQDINTGLQQAIEQISADTDSESGYHGSFSELAKIGKYVFVKIFADRALREVISSLEPGATITLSSDNFFIPWELLYNGPSEANADLSHFWGMRHSISRTLVPDHNGNYEGLKRPHLPPRPQVGLITYISDDLEYIVEQEITALENLVQKNQIFLHHLRALDTDKGFDELEYLKDFLCEKDLQVVHLACHAHEEKLSSKSYLLISNDFPVTIEDFATHEFQIKNYPLVILNACLTGTINPLSAIANWAILFRKIGARGVLATEFHVPDWFAADFIEELYGHLLSGKQIGEALWTTRRHFWDFLAEQGNPLGMAYAFYGPPSLRMTARQQSAAPAVPITNAGG